MIIQGSAKRLWPGLVNFITAVAYHFCLSLPAAFTQPGRSLLADPCRDCFINIVKKMTTERGESYRGRLKGFGQVA